MKALLPLFFHIYIYYYKIELAQEMHMGLQMMSIFKKK
jgi:hypothetical protein